MKYLNALLAKNPIILGNNTAAPRSFGFFFLIHVCLFSSSHRNIKKDDLVLPRPPLLVAGYNAVILSWVAAMKYVGMAKYSEELTYSADVPESMNDATLEDGVVEPLPRRVEEIFKEFKMNLSQGVVRRKRVHSHTHQYLLLSPQFSLLLACVLDSTSPAARFGKNSLLTIHTISSPVSLPF